MNDPIVEQTRGAVPPSFDVHQAFQAASYGPPPAVIATRDVHRMRVASNVWLALWLPGIFLVQGINADARPMAWGLITAGAALTVGSLLVIVVYRVQRWRRGWRPWRIFGDIYPRI
jgi:hypothetical protein